MCLVPRASVHLETGKEEKGKLVALSHQMVSGSLALLYIFRFSWGEAGQRPQ